MVAQGAALAGEARHRFIAKGWAVLMKYLDRIDDDDLVAATDARAGASVVKTLFDSLDKAETGVGAEEEIELPQIPEEILEQIRDAALGNGKTGRPRAPEGGAKVSRVPHRPYPECQA